MAMTQASSLPRPPSAVPDHRSAWRRVAEAVITLLVGVLYVPGYVLGVTLWPLWLGVSWAVAAVGVGVRDGSAVWRNG